MAYATPRSCRTEMLLGTTAGRYKRANMNWVIPPGSDNATSETRKQMSGLWHGFSELETKITPTGQHVVDPYYVDVAPMDGENV